MAYSYETERPRLMTDEGQRGVIKLRDKVLALLKTAGAVRAGEIMSYSELGDSWQMLAAIDRLVELGDIREI